MSQNIIGVDIGGTTYSSTLFNNKLNEICKSEKHLIAQCSSKSSFLELLSKQILGLIKDYSKDSIVGIGIACPGPLDSKSGVILETPNLKILQNINLKKELELILKLPVYIENDANLFALGEWFSSNSKNDEVFTGLTLGTGLGFGIIINGKIYSGAHGLAAEYGISPVETGNWEDKISIKAINKMSQKYFKNKRLTPEDLFQMANNEDSHAIKLWNEFGNNLGLALSHFINLIDPHKISIGGGISNAFKHFNESMINRIKEYSPAYNQFNIDIFESINKELSAQLGAAILVKDYYKKN